MLNLDEHEISILYIYFYSCDTLDAYASAADLKIGSSEVDKNSIIRDIVSSETEHCMIFASQNPEISLPDALDDALCVDNGVYTPEQYNTTSYRSGGTAASIGSVAIAPKSRLCSLSHPYKIP